MDALSWWVLAGVVTTLLGVGSVDRHISRLRSKRLRQLAENAGFRYSPADRFALAGRIRDVMPSGPMNVRDLMYRSDRGGHAYLFTVIIEGEQGGRFVFAGRERSNAARLGDLRRGDPGLSLLKQYGRLLHDFVPSTADPLEPQTPVV